jgi:hypothetical protein
MQVLEPLLAHWPPQPVWAWPVLAGDAQVRVPVQRRQAGVHAPPVGELERPVAAEYLGRWTDWPQQREALE